MPTNRFFRVHAEKHDDGGPEQEITREEHARLPFSQIDWARFENRCYEEHRPWPKEPETDD
jgi:hypothetical protein